MEEKSLELSVTFPSCSEDHRLQLVEINGAIFAIVHAALASDGPINLNCHEWNLVLLAPIKSKVDVNISGVNIIILGEIQSEEGSVNIEASNKLVKFAASKMAPEKLRETGKQGEFNLGDDPGAYIHFVRSFTNIVISSRNEDTLVDAQEEFIKAICLLAGKIEKKSEILNVQRVLGIWGIPPVKS